MKIDRLETCIALLAALKAQVQAEVDERLAYLIRLEARIKDLERLADETAVKKDA